MIRPHLDSLAQRVKMIRKHRGLSQEELAERSTMAQSDISKIERGLIMKTTGIVRLAEALAVPPAWLERGEEPEPDLVLFDQDGKFVTVIEVKESIAPPLAHRLSHARPIVELTKIDRGEIMKGNLPTAFSLEAWDDSMAPLLAKGHTARFSARDVEKREDLPGKKVLVVDKDGEPFIREYRHRRGNHWQAVPLNEAAGFDPLDSIADGLEVLAVMTGVDWE